MHTTRPSFLRNLLYPAADILACLCLANCTLAQTSTERIGGTFSSPLYLTHPPGDTSRVFVLEKGSTGTARIKVMDLSTGSASTFLTIGGLLTTGERGLLGMAFDPNYAQNGFFYTYTSHPGGGADHHSEVRRYTAVGDPATATTADPGSAALLMNIAQPFSNHNAGWMGFRPGASEPNLYIASGDGGNGNDPQNNAQDITNNHLGKMLRIHVAGDDFPTDPNRNYAIPADNPFVNTTGDDEIWAYGLRNPWRNSFDRNTGDLLIGDVGQQQREEINLEPADSPGGLNYGWKVEEGNRCHNNQQIGGNPPCGDPSLVPPIYDYFHNSGGFGGFSVTGGYVYHGSVAQYEGLYFFADYVTENIWTLDSYADDVGDTVIRRNNELVPDMGSFSGIASFGEDAEGELYIVSLVNGNVHKIVSTARDAVWNGDDASAGNAGDGSSWLDANNWTRGGERRSRFQQQGPPGVCPRLKREHD